MTSRTYFSLSDGVLRITRDDPAFDWTGRPDNLDVLDLHVIDDGAAALVLLDAPAGGGLIRNLVRVDSLGRVSWHGQLPQAADTDCFVGFEVEQDGTVRASTWSGYRVRLSAYDGHLINSEFAK